MLKQVLFQGDLQILCGEGANVDEYMNSVRLAGAKITEKTAEPDGTIIVVASEKSGHDHRIKGDRKVFEVADDKGGVATVVAAGENAAEVVHHPNNADHAPVGIPPGEGAVIRRQHQFTDAETVVVRD